MKVVGEGSEKPEVIRLMGDGTGCKGKKAFSNQKKNANIERSGEKTRKKVLRAFETSVASALPQS